MDINSASLFPELERDLEHFHTTGILPYQEIRDLIDRGVIRSKTPVLEGQLQPSSIDLRLGPVGYRVRASFLPTEQSNVQNLVDRLSLETLDLTTHTVL